MTRISVVISICNRIRLFERGLFTLYRQSLPKKDYEVIVVCDNRSTEDVHAVLRPYITQMQMQWALIDNSRWPGPFKIESHTPALANNIGFRLAKGEVVVVSQPEILHEQTNLQYLYESAMQNVTVYGNIRHSGPQFPESLDIQERAAKQKNEIPQWRQESWQEWMTYRDTDMRTTHDLLHGMYWYVAGVRKYFVELMRGVDEEYLRGVYGEDDNWKYRLEVAGAKPMIDWRVLGIHQDHFNETTAWQNRTSDDWNRRSQINRERLAWWNQNKTLLANEKWQWGDFSAIVDHRVYGIDGFAENKIA